MGVQSSRRRLLVAWLHLGVLWAFAFAQPLLNLLGDTPEFFVARGNTRGDILLVALVLTFVPPTLMALAELAVSPWPRVRELLHLGLVGLLAAAIALQVLGALPPALAIGVAAALGAAGALAYARLAPARSFLTVLSPAPVAFVAYFLLASPVSELVLPQGTVLAKGGAGNGAPVVVLVFDEFSGQSLLDRDDRIDASRYPNLASLARRSTWYRDATSVEFATERAVPAVLTGVQPEAQSLPIASDHPRNLFTLLGSRYRFRVQEPATELCPESLCGERVRQGTPDRLRSLAHDLRIVGLHLLLPEDLEDELPAIDTTFEGFGNAAGRPASPGDAISGVPESAFRDREGQFSRFLASIRGGEQRPSLTFLHVALPHWPWQYLPSGRQYPTETARIPGLEGSTWGKDGFLPLQAHQRYLAQLGFADALVGRLMARMRERGVWDRTLLVVTSDHGVSFRPGQPRRVTTQENFPDIASVPLFIKAPGQTDGRVDDSPVRTTDILPTVADLLDLRSGWSFDGRSARDGISGRSTVGVMTGDLVSMRFESFRRARDAAVREQAREFGSGDGGAGIFQIGPYPGLLGARPATLPAAEGPSLRAELDDRALLQTVDLRSRLLPAFVRGRLTGAPAGTTVAIAVNGRIRATVPAYTDGGETRFAALVDPRAFRQGRNDVRLYAVASGGRALAPIEQEGERGGPSGRVEGEGEDTKVEAGGRTLALDPERATGFLEQADAPDPGHVSLTGWAADPRGKQRVARVLVYADGRLIASIRPDVPRLDVAARFGRPTLLAGFKLNEVVTDAEAVAGDPGRLRVFAVIDGRATELERLGAGG